MSKYLQCLTSYLHDQGLLSDELKAALLEHDKEFTKKPSAKINFGKYKTRTVAEVAEFDLPYLQWLFRQQYIKEKFQDIYNEIKSLLE